MCPCDPNEIVINLPDGPSGPAIPGFGPLFGLNLPTNILPEGFPENILELLDKLNFLIPPGNLKSNPNFQFMKDIYDAIMKMMDYFLPFLMLYKFFLPLLNLIICIIEVLCALMNPFKLRKAIRRLFLKCLPEFLNLFPIFALILMIISLLLLLLELIKYIIRKILQLIELILRNIRALLAAFADADNQSILAIARKIGDLLCIFQNLFVLLSFFTLIFQVIREILSFSFRLPPCKRPESSDEESDCCDAESCPGFISLAPHGGSTASFKYLNEVQVDSGLPLPADYPLRTTARPTTYQLFDSSQDSLTRFINIVDAADVTTSPKPVYFPTDANYTSSTPPKQAPYTVDLRMYYNPASFGRDGYEKFIQFKDCIVKQVPTSYYYNYDNSITTISTGVLHLVGGKGYEDDGTTLLNGYATDGITELVGTPATLENFILYQTVVTTSTPVFSLTDGYQFNDVEYTWRVNHDVLFSKALITSGCLPGISEARDFTNQVFASNVDFNQQQLQTLMFATEEDPTGSTNPTGNISFPTDADIAQINFLNFPNPAKTQECLNAALTTLISNINEGGVSNFQATSVACLSELEDQTNKAINSLLDLIFDPNKSTFTLEPSIQFTTKTIKVKVDLKTNSGQPIAINLPESVSSEMLGKLKAIATFGEVSDFTYDGYQFFNTEIKSDIKGSGLLSISYDNKLISTITIPQNIDDTPTVAPTELEYQFVFTPTNIGAFGIPGTGAGDTSEGIKPRRDESDIGREGGS